MQTYEKVFGQYINNKSQKSSDNIMICCPWHDDSTASLAISTDENKQVYQCFGCGKKGTLIGAMMDLHGLDYKSALKALDQFDENYASRPIQHRPSEPIPEPEPDMDYTDYCLSAVENFHKHYEFFGKKLYELRCITFNTAIACRIGYDANKGWIFPIIRYGDGVKAKIIGYEIREKNFGIFEFNKSKCYKAKGSPSCLSVVYEPVGGSKKAICCEGYIDSLFMFQYLFEKNKGKQVDTTILTPSCGVKHLPNLVESCELWNDFDEVLFCLDNDSAGNGSTEVINQLSHEGKFKFFGSLAEDEDFELYYHRVLKNI